MGRRRCQCVAAVTREGVQAHTVGNVGTKAPDVAQVGADLTPVASAQLAGRSAVLIIFPSVDTGICATSVS